ncbi:MAG: hypothetical protein HY047_14155 [Acidobacteria bacterium]|nr:hypothetical protein [Acidobacteriota bacterium]
MRTVGRVLSDPAAARSVGRVLSDPADAAGPEDPPYISHATYISRAIGLLRTAGIGAAWDRTRTQLASVRQLIAWEFALRRTRRAHHQ